MRYEIFYSRASTTIPTSKAKLASNATGLKLCHFSRPTCPPPHKHTHTHAHDHSWLSEYNRKNFSLNAEKNPIVYSCSRRTTSSVIYVAGHDTKPTVGVLKCRTTRMPAGKMFCGICSEYQGVRLKVRRVRWWFVTRVHYNNKTYDCSETFPSGPTYYDNVLCACHHYFEKSSNPLRYAMFCKLNIATYLSNNKAVGHDITRNWNGMFVVLTRHI
jgi:hypothetical protein